MPTKATLLRMTRQEKKADATTRTARKIAKPEAAARQTRTPALRETRREKKVANEPSPEAPRACRNKPRAARA